MKDLQDIEKLLEKARPPDQDVSKTRHHIWQEILNRRKNKNRRGFPISLPPWIWVVASLALILICILFMIFIHKAGS